MEGWAVLLGFKSSGASQEEAAAGTHTPLWKAVGRFSQTHRFTFSVTWWSNL